MKNSNFSFALRFIYILAKSFSTIPVLNFFIALLVFSFYPNGSCGESVSGDTIHKNGTLKVMHIGWDDGHVREFTNAYTLHRNEIRINIIGRSSYAFSDKVEMSTYLPMLITPNIAFKYNFIDKKHFASAIEVGTATGIFPIAAAGGIIMPGGAVGAGSIGIIHGTDNHLKLFLSFPVSNKLTFSVRGSASAIHAAYTGGAAIAGIGGNGAAAGLIPINVGHSFRFYMGGFETDYVWNKQNAMVLNTSLGGFKGGKKQLGMATLSWTHSKTHFHYSFGLYGFYDPPTYEMIHESKLPVAPYANIYWIFNNGGMIKINSQ